MEKASVIIKSVSPLLMHRFPMIQIEGIEKRNIEEQAEYAAYRDETTKQLYVPAINLQRCLVGAATYSKGKGRASLQKVAAACIFVMPEYLYLGTDKYEIDARPVVIPATKGRVIRYRPKLFDWRLSFELEWDGILLKETEVRKIVDDAGSRVGLLEFNPAHKGPFGRFMVTEWNK